MDIKEVERLIVGLQDKLFKKSSSQGVGVFKSHQRGSGLQFKEHLVYTHGDDVRFIDWRQSAKSQKTFIKTFEAEKNVELHVAIDISESLLLGYQGKTKLEGIIELLALILLVAGKSQDLISLYLWTENCQVLSKINGKQGLVKLISLFRRSELMDTQDNINYDYHFSNVYPEQKKIAWVKSMIAQKKEVLLFTDFSQMDKVSEWEKVIKNPLVHSFQLLSPIELMEKSPGWFTSSGGGGYLNLKGQNNFFDNKYIKRLKLDEDYLKLFIKEMIRL